MLIPFLDAILVVSPWFISKESATIVAMVVVSFYFLIGNALLLISKKIKKKTQEPKKKFYSIVVGILFIYSWARIGQYAAVFGLLFITYIEQKTLYFQTEERNGGPHE
jgi:hypothetical protein